MVADSAKVEFAGFQGWLHRSVLVEQVGKDGRWWRMQGARDSRQIRTLKKVHGQGNVLEMNSFNRQQSCLWTEALTWGIEVALLRW